MQFQKYFQFKHCKTVLFLDSDVSGTVAATSRRDGSFSSWHDKQLERHASMTSSPGLCSRLRLRLLPLYNPPHHTISRDVRYADNELDN